MREDKNMGIMITLKKPTLESAGDPGGPWRTRHLAACRAHELMPLRRGHHRLDRGNLHDLMAPRREIISR